MDRGLCWQAPVFWRAPYRALLNSRHLVEYMVLDIEPTGQTAANGKLELADAQVARVADLGSNDTTYHVRTHLGHLLNPGDTALGYDLTRANFVEDELENFVQKGNSLPDVVLVSFSYAWLGMCVQHCNGSLVVLFHCCFQLICNNPTGRTTDLCFACTPIFAPWFKTSNGPYLYHLPACIPIITRVTLA